MVLTIAVQPPLPFDSSKRNKGLSNSAYSAESQINDLHELVGVDDALAPGGVEIGEGLLRHGFQRGFSRGS
jgi:hypothetical protein